MRVSGFAGHCRNGNLRAGAYVSSTLEFLEVPVQTLSKIAVPDAAVGVCAR